VNAKPKASKTKLTNSVKAGAAAVVADVAVEEEVSTEVAEDAPVVEAEAIEAPAEAVAEVEAEATEAPAEEAAAEETKAE